MPPTPPLTNANPALPNPRTGTRVWLLLLLALPLSACPGEVPTTESFAQNTAQSDGQHLGDGELGDSAAPDGGAGMPDAGPNTADAGAATQDAAAATQDAGAATQDAGGATKDAGAATQDAGGAADTSGCSGNKDCPQPKTPCQVATCSAAGACVTGPVSDGTSCGTQGGTCANGICVVPPKVTGLGLGDYTSCAVQDNAVWCWGSNNRGQLGNGKSGSSQWSLWPASVIGLPPAQDVACGDGHCCARAASGDVWCWGGNDYGQVSQAKDLSNHTKPVKVTLPAKAIALTTGDHHTCVALATGKVVCWGLGSSGQLGDGNGGISPSPVEATGIKGVVQVCAGLAFTCARSSTGQAWCWGMNSHGQTGAGFGGTSSFVNQPAAVADLQGIAAIACGHLHACAATKSGEVWCWGHNGYRQLGSGKTNTSYNKPVQSYGIAGAVDVAAGEAHSCATDGKGQLWCWGGNQNDQTATSKGKSIVELPAKVAQTAKLLQLDAGRMHTCGTDDAGGLWCWGGNNQGQVGNGGQTAVDKPTKVAP